MTKSLSQRSCASDDQFLLCLLGWLLHINIQLHSSLSSPKNKAKQKNFSPHSPPNLCLYAHLLQNQISWKSLTLNYLHFFHFFYSLAHFSLASISTASLKWLLPRPPMTSMALKQKSIFQSSLLGHSAAFDSPFLSKSLSKWLYNPWPKSHLLTSVLYQNISFWNFRGQCLRPLSTQCAPPGWSCLFPTICWELPNGYNQTVSPSYTKTIYSTLYMLLDVPWTSQTLHV